jgi:hypothetical protein
LLILEPQQPSLPCSAWHHDPVQLLNVTLYHRDGRQREVEFRPGRVNVVTGGSRTGKSALLDIVDFCLGRDDVHLPPGVIADTVDWVGTLWELAGGSRMYLARPVVKPGRLGTSQAMISFGGPELGSPPKSDLTINTDSARLREQVGLRIGIGDAKLAPPEGSMRSPYTVGLGQASIFLFQQQHEIASKALLFHRQGEEGMAGSIRDSLPFFLGAVPGNQAEKVAQLRLARRDLRRVEIELDAANHEAQTVEVRLQSLLAEAHAVGLTEVEVAPSAAVALEILSRIRFARRAEIVPSADVSAQDRRRELESEGFLLRQELGRALDERALLLDSTTSEGGYDSAITQQMSRLQSLYLIPHESDPHGGSVCPVCLQTLKGDDPTPEALTQRLSDLSSELKDLAAAQPGRQKALRELGNRATELRERLVAVDAAIATLRSADKTEVGTNDADRQQFVRGRIDATLSRTAATDDGQRMRLAQRLLAAQQRVEALESEVDDNSTREKLTSLLVALGRDMTSIAQSLELEHSSENVRLDVAKLTVVTDTASGPEPLTSLGSGENWVGYHLAAHLALHKFFVNQGRPVPRLLMLDQPTQVYYESKSPAEADAIRKSGRPADSDHENVARMFKLFVEVAASVAPGLQIIVSDHADLPEPWFQDLIEHSWRHGAGLIPSDWFDSL